MESGIDDRSAGIRRQCRCVTDNRHHFDTGGSNPAWRGEHTAAGYNNRDQQNKDKAREKVHNNVT
nr:hypothetical protein [Noviherbaspirillum saxi]